MMQSFFRWYSFMFLMSIPLFGFSQDIPAVNENDPDSFDTLQIKLPKAYWFNSYKFQVGDYAKGKSKQSSNSVAQSSKKGIDEDISSYKFTISLENSNSETSLITGEYTKRTYYTTKQGVLLEVITGIESESIELISMWEQKTATITTSINENDPWEFVFIESSSLENSDKLPTILRSDYRTIQVVTSKTEHGLFEISKFNNGEYTYIENGAILGKLIKDGGHLILIRKNMDPYTKLIIISSMVIFLG